jgi:subtilisin-like proprotein convertase family protein
MKKQTRIMVFVGALVLLGASAFAGVWVDWPVGAQVADNDPMGVQDTRTLSGYEGVIQSVEVRVTFTGMLLDYAYNGDYFVALQHDSGYAVLLNRTGRTASSDNGYNNNGFDVVFTLGGNDVHRYQDYAPSYDGSGRLTGTWGVDGRNVDPDLVLDTSPRTDMLASFTGIDPNGDWTLFVADMNQNAMGSLDSWGLNVTVVPEPSTALLFSLGLAGLLARRKRASA